MNFDWTIVVFLLAILVVAGLLVAVIMITKKSAPGLDLAVYRSRWLKIEQVLSRDEPSSYLLAILEADKLLDQALRDRGIAGQTMGERMKAAQATWSNANAVWGAHKVRNRIAHESGFQVSYDETRRALGGFRQGLKDLGAI